MTLCEHEARYRRQRATASAQNARSHHFWPYASGAKNEPSGGRELFSAQPPAVHCTRTLSKHPRLSGMPSRAFIGDVGVEFYSPVRKQASTEQSASLASAAPIEPSSPAIDSTHRHPTNHRYHTSNPPPASDTYPHEPSSPTIANPSPQHRTCTQKCHSDTRHRTPPGLAK